MEPGGSSTWASRDVTGTVHFLLEKVNNAFDNEIFGKETRSLNPSRIASVHGGFICGKDMKKIRGGLKKYPEKVEHLGGYKDQVKTDQLAE